MIAIAELSKREHFPSQPFCAPFSEAVEDSPAPDNAKQLATLVEFLRQYLVCDEHQFTVLALWIVHTWCFELFSTAAYLNVRSPEPQSGKTLCLDLLDLLCRSPWLAPGADSRTVVQQLLKGEHRAAKAETSETPLRCTLLLDDCQHTLGLSERQPLVAMFNSGARAASRYVRGGRRFCLFGPKAFAANALLPHSLAARCIPVVLMRKPSSAVVSRFIPAEARAQAAHLLAWLADWQKSNASALARQADRSGVIDFAASAPTPHAQECAESLLCIADVIGGHWPERARAALASVFHCAETSLSVQLLSDIRLWFYVRGNPQYLSSSDLLASLATLDHRPWSAWPANSGRRLAALLHPFGIFSRNLHSSGRVFKGYMFKNLQGAFDRYLPPLRIGSAAKPQSAAPSATEFPSIFNDLSA